MNLEKIISCVRDMQHAEEQSAKWMAALKKMAHDVIGADDAPRDGNFVTVGELSTFILRSHDSASRQALCEMLARFTWIKADCALWDLSRAIHEYPEQVQTALINAAKECDIGE